jgi:hypothetical protein
MGCNALVSWAWFKYTLLLVIFYANFAVSIIAGAARGTHMNGGALKEWKPTNRLLFD